MPAARGVKRTASKSSASTASAAPKNKKKRNVIQLEVPTLPKKRGRVLTCGQGDVGQLGLGEDVIETTRFKHVTGLSEKIVYVCAGGMHTIALDSDGKVWTFGCNDEGALGRTTTGETDEGTPKPVDLPLPAVTISAGDSHSAALLNNGHVYAWGAFRDSHGSMGLVVRGREGKACRQPARLELPEPAAALASGGDHLAVLTTSGSVYTMGCGEQGQLGRLAQRSATRDTRQGFSALLVPAKVTLKAGATQLWAGYHATFIVDANDKVLAWGLNNYGQLGITGEKRKTALFSPLECDAFTCCNTSWKQVACGQHHSLALDEKGQCYSIGRCEYGRLGLGDRTGDAEALEPIPKLQNVKCVSIAAGTSNSFAVTDTGEVLAWGMGSEGQLGTGGAADAPEPTAAALTALSAAPALRPALVSAGGQHTVVLAVDPNPPPREPSASPEPEEEKMEDKKEEKVEGEPAEKKPRGRGKRGKQPEQEDDVSSTSTASAAQKHDVTENAPQKVNGDEKKETPMEVDETDSKQDSNKKEESTDKKESEDKKEPEATKPETDNSSQDTVESDSKPDTDVEMEPEKQEKPEPEQKNVANEPLPTETKTEVNGTPEEMIEKTKPVEIVSEEMTTTA